MYIFFYFRCSLWYRDYDDMKNDLSSYSWTKGIKGNNNNNDDKGTGDMSLLQGICFAVTQISLDIMMHIKHFPSRDT